MRESASFPENNTPQARACPAYPNVALGSPKPAQRQRGKGTKNMKKVVVWTRTLKKGSRREHPSRIKEYVIYVGDVKVAANTDKDPYSKRLNVSFYRTFGALSKKQLEREIARLSLCNDKARQWLRAELQKILTRQEKREQIEKTESILGNVVYIYRGHSFWYARNLRWWKVVTQQLWGKGRPVFRLLATKEECLEYIDYLVEVDGEKESN